MKKILMFLIENEFNIQVEGRKVLLASTDKYIFSMDKIGNYWNVELMEFASNSFGKRMTLTKVGVKDTIIFLKQKVR